jgi:hypothetical protein
MGIGELRSKVVVEMKYDTSDARASLKHLQGEEKKTGELRIQLAEMENKKIEQTIKNYGRLSTGLQIANMSGIDLGKSIRELTNIPIGGPGSAIGFMFGGPWGAAIGTIGEMLGGKLADAFGKSTRAARDMDLGYVRLVEALKEVNKEEEDFAKELRATQDAARALDPIIGGVSRALNENMGKFQAAKDAVVSYSIALSDVQRDRRAVFEGPFKDGPDTFVSRQEVELTRSLRDAKIALTGATSSYGSVAADAQIKTLRNNEAIADARAAYKAGALSAEQYKDVLTGLGIKFEDIRKKQKEWFDLLRDPPKFLDTNSAAWERELAGRARDTAAYDRSIASEWSRDPLVGPADRSTADAEAVANAQIRASVMAADAAKQALESVNGPTLTERVFGSIEDLVSRQEAWAVVTSSATAGYDAIVDGTGSVGKKMKQAAADSIKAIGQTMLIQGLEQSAKAIGAAATLNWPAAAAHGLSAAKFFAGATLAGVAANGIGTSAGVAAGEARAQAAERDKPKAPSVSGGSGSGSDRVITERIIVYSDAFAEDSARGKQLQADRIVARALGNSAVRNS